MLYDFFWVIPRRLNFICRRFETLYLFHLHRHLAYEDGTNSVPKRRHIKFRRRGITQKKSYNIQNTAKVLNQKQNYIHCFILCKFQNFFRVTMRYAAVYIWRKNKI
jgi:hypothetical protein